VIEGSRTPRVRSGGQRAPAPTRSQTHVCPLRGIGAPVKRGTQPRSHARILRPKHRHLGSCLRRTGSGLCGLLPLLQFGQFHPEVNRPAARCCPQDCFRLLGSTPSDSSPLPAEQSTIPNKWRSGPGWAGFFSGVPALECRLPVVNGVCLGSKFPSHALPCVSTTRPGETRFEGLARR
jgi:hypothetical protein